MAAGKDMLEAARNYLDITYADQEADRKLEGIIERGKAYLDNMAGGELDYAAESAPRALLLDYCRYARNNAMELFGDNFRAELIALRIGVQANDYAEKQGYI